MGRFNRGETTKLSIRLSSAAREKIEAATINLNLSKAGVILFVLTKIIEDFPSKLSVINMENKIDLEPANFALNLKQGLADKISRIAAEYDMKKNILIGLVVSDYFLNEINPDIVVEREPYEDPSKVLVQVNKELKKKMNEYSEHTFIPLSGLVSYSILKGHYQSLPIYTDNESVAFFTNIPPYLSERVKAAARERHIKESFYIELCLYKVFMSNEKEFDLK